jgi:hypothetical protein
MALFGQRNQALTAHCNSILPYEHSRTGAYDAQMLKQHYFYNRLFLHQFHERMRNMWNTRQGLQCAFSV